MPFNFNLPVRYGLIGGFIICIISLVSYLFYQQLFGSLTIQSIFGIAYFGLIIFIPVWGTVSCKRAVGKLTFQQAFLTAIVIVAITMAFSSVMSYVIPNLVDTDYPTQLYDLVVKNTTETMEKFGAPDDKIEEALERIKPEDFKPTLLATLKSYGISIAAGAVLSVLIGLFVSRPDKQQPVQTAE